MGSTSRVLLAGLLLNACGALGEPQSMETPDEGGAQDGTDGGAPSTNGGSSGNDPAGAESDDPSGGDNGSDESSENPSNPGGGSSDDDGNSSPGSSESGQENDTGGQATDEDPAPEPFGSVFARLTRNEYRATVQSALGVTPDVNQLPEDGRLGPFTSNASASTDPVHPYMLAAEELAASLIPSSFAACGADQAVDCITDEYASALEALYRRPLTAAELETAARMVVDQVAQGASAQDATRAMLAAALMSPDFLFRTPPTAAGEAPEQRRAADQLSFTLWDAPPDETLASLPASADQSGLEGEAVRLLQDERATPVVARFIAQWLDVDTDLRLESDSFAESAAYSEWLSLTAYNIENDVPIAELLTSSRGFVHRENAETYALDEVDADSDDPVAIVQWGEDSPRRGVLAQDLLAASSRHPDLTRRPIFRGLLVRRALLCDEIPAPSADLVALAGEVGDRTQDPRCGGCHQLIDPIGYAFGALDADIDDAPTSAEIIGHAELAGTYDSLPALLEAIAGSRAFAECFAEHWLEFFLERPASELDEGSIAEIADLVAAGAGFGAVVQQSTTQLLLGEQTTQPWCEGQ